jgi:hypothetical protein
MSVTAIGGSNALLVWIRLPFDVDQAGGPSIVASETNIHVERSACANLSTNSDPASIGGSDTTRLLNAAAPF